MFVGTVYDCSFECRFYGLASSSSSEFCVSFLCSIISRRPNPECGLPRYIKHSHTHTVLSPCQLSHFHYDELVPVLWSPGRRIDNCYLAVDISIIQPPVFRIAGGRVMSPCLSNSNYSHRPVPLCAYIIVTEPTSKYINIHTSLGCCNE